MNKPARLLLACLIPVVAVASFGSSHVSASAGTVTSEISVDCLAPPENRLNVWNYESETITVNFSNCDAFQWEDSNGDPKSGSLVSPIVITAGDWLGLYNTIAPTTVEIRSGILHTARTPAGELQFTQNVTIGTNPRSFYAGTEDDGADGDHLLGGKRLCGLEVDGGQRHIYTTLDVTIVKAGLYTFRAVDSSPVGYYISDGDFHPIADSFLALYSSFDPQNPDENVLGCNDDLNDRFGYDNNPVAEVLSDGSWMEGHHPYFSADLQPGEYTLLVTTWEAISKSEWLAGGSEPRSWTPGEATLTFELWGPVASLCVGHDPNCDPVEPTLPPTGSGSRPTSSVALVAVILGAIFVMGAKSRKVV